MPRAFLNSPVPPTMAMTTGGVFEVTQVDYGLGTDIAPAVEFVRSMERNHGIVSTKFCHERAAHCERADRRAAAIIQPPFKDQPWVTSFWLSRLEEVTLRFLLSQCERWHGRLHCRPL